MGAFIGNLLKEARTTAVASLALALAALTPVGLFWLGNNHPYVFAALLGGGTVLCIVWLLIGAVRDYVRWARFKFFTGLEDKVLPAPGAPFYTNKADSRSFDSWPAPFRFPYFETYCGAHRTTMSAAGKFLLTTNRDAARAVFAGAAWPLTEFFTLTTLIFGKPGSGKTKAIENLIVECGRNAQNVGLSLYVLDPTDAYLPLCYRAFPFGTEIIRATPHDAMGRKWNVRRDVTDAKLAKAFAAAVVEKFKTGNRDPFWYSKAEQIIELVIRCHQHLGGEWEFRDIITPLVFGDLLLPFLKLCPDTAPFAKNDLGGEDRLHRDLIATVTSCLEGLDLVAADWDQATGDFSLSELAEGGSKVFHFSFGLKNKRAYSGITNAMTQLLSLIRCSGEPRDGYLLCVVDEAREVGGVGGFDTIAARGRAYRTGLLAAVQSEVDWARMIGRETVEGIVDIASTVICLSVGPYTADVVSKFCGTARGRELNGSTSSSIDHKNALNRPGGLQACESDANWDYKALREVALAAVRDSLWAHHYDDRAEYMELDGPLDVSDPDVQKGLRALARGHFRAVYTKATGGTEPPPLTPSFASSNGGWGIKEISVVLAGELTGLPPADPEADRARGYVSNNKTGTYYFEVPFLEPQKGLPPAPFDRMPERPTKSLRTWDEADLKRLNVPNDSELVDVVRTMAGGGKKP